MIIHVVIGTKAQWIKMAPVLVELARRGLPFRVIDTGQHGEITAQIRRAFSLPEPQLVLHSGVSAKTVGGGLRWLRLLAARLTPGRKALLEQLFGGESGPVLVHGDNLTTLWGAIAARRAGLPLAIVEAGLRSWHPLHPFPEEIIRMALPHLAYLLFAPSEKAVANLKRMKVKGKIIFTRGNTIADALRFFLKNQSPQPEDFGLWNFHRLETLLSRRRLKRLCQLLLSARKYGPVKFIVDLPTRPRLEQAGWLERFEKAGIELLPVLPYPDFVRLLARARYVATDGGSIQEECALLGVPCLILRHRTERLDGLGRNAVLVSKAPLAEFIKVIDIFRSLPLWPEKSPSGCICDQLAAARLINPS